MTVRRKLLALLVAAATVTAAGCGATTADAPGGETTQEPPMAEPKDAAAGKTGSTSEPDNTSTAKVENENEETLDCPVTIPPQPGFEPGNLDEAAYSENFPEPDPPPIKYPHEGMVWYGSDELWTALPVDGEYSPRKSVWWSANFPGGIVEGEPEVWVTWTRLDTDEPVVVDNSGKATNAYTPQEGWFMIAGGDPSDAEALTAAASGPGCWEVEATYKGATLSYVYELSE